MRVLVIEDEVRLAETIRRGLVSEGFSVDVNHRGDDGFETATADHFDAIVVDIMLPGMSGYEIVRGLRARRAWTPILMLSAKDGEYDLADAFDLGADDYLVKPFSFVVLSARLRALVRRGAPARPAVLTAGDLELDPASRRVGEHLVGGMQEVQHLGQPDVRDSLVDNLFHFDRRDTGGQGGAQHHPVLIERLRCDHRRELHHQPDANVEVAVLEHLVERRVELPLPAQSASTPHTRAEVGLAVQNRIVGEDKVAGMYAGAADDEAYFQRYLSANCFGDYVARSGIDLQTREWLTFSMLVALGGADAQVKGHVAGNNIGNDRGTLLAVLTQLLPFIGYPRTLSGLAAVNEITSEEGKQQ